VVMLASESGNSGSEMACREQKIPYIGRRFLGYLLLRQMTGGGLDYKM
jgi:hypothetical protein